MGADNIALYHGSGIKTGVSSLVFLLGLLFTLPASAEGRFEAERTHALIVGVLSWETSSVASFSARGRHDVKLKDALLELGVPASNVTLLLDEAATRELVLSSLEEVAGGAEEGDNLLFYYAGHGELGSEGVHFLNYDAAPGNVLSLSTIQQRIEENFRGDSVWLLADCCYSGALGELATALESQGVASVSLTSTTADRLSTSNWTFTQALVDALRGHPAADTNGDRVVSLGEVAEEVKDAMMGCEGQPYGYTNAGLSEDTQVCEVETEIVAQPPPPPYELYEYVQVRRDASWGTGRVVGYQAGMYRVRIQRYSDRLTLEVPGDGVRKFPGPPPEPSEEQALARAAVGGKYRKLLRQLKVPGDYLDYSEFNDFGFYEATNYNGHQNLPEGYWVYVYPYWFIWQTAR